MYVGKNLTYYNVRRKGINWIRYGWREINQQDATNPMFIIKLLSQHVSGIIMPIIRSCSPDDGIMMPETCCDRSLIINIGLVASCGLSLFTLCSMMHCHKNLKLTESEFRLVVQNTDQLAFYRGTTSPCGHNHMQHEHLVKWCVRLTWSNNYDLLINQWLNMFRAPVCPSSGVQGCTLLHMVFSTVKDKTK